MRTQLKCVIMKMRYFSDFFTYFFKVLPINSRSLRKISVRANVPDERNLNNNYSMSPSWIWSDKITNERVVRVGYNRFISNKGDWNHCFSKFSNRVLPRFFFHNFTKPPERKFLNLAHYFPYDVKLRLLAHSRSFLANQKARNAIVGAENLLKADNRRWKEEAR